MTYQQVLENARTCIGPYCKACNDCNGKVCRNTMPGPGAKGEGTGFIRNAEKWREICVNMDTICENSQVDTSFTLFGRTFEIPAFAAPVGAMRLHYGDKYDDLTYNNILVRACANAGILAFTGDGTDPKVVEGAAKALKAQLIRMADGRQVNLVLTTGGTGFSPRDITPEATCAVADRNAPGIAEAMRYHSLSITPRGMLSRGVSVLRGKTLIVNLPGSPKAVQENLEYILPSLEHGVRIAAGLDGECARK